MHAVIQFIQALHFSNPNSKHSRPRRQLPDLTVVPMLGILSEQPDEVRSAVARHRASLKNPPKAVEEYLAILAEGGFPQTVAALCHHADSL